MQYGLYSNRVVILLTPWTFCQLPMLALLTRWIAQHQKLGFAAILGMLVLPDRLLDLRMYTGSSGDTSIPECGMLNGPKRCWRGCCCRSMYNFCCVPHCNVASIKHLVYLCCIRQHSPHAVDFVRVHPGASCCFCGVSTCVPLRCTAACPHVMHKTNFSEHPSAHPQLHSSNHGYSTPPLANPNILPSLA
jgi:hypothetical protein